MTRAGRSWVKPGNDEEGAFLIRIVVLPGDGIAPETIDSGELVT